MLVWIVLLGTVLLLFYIFFKDIENKYAAPQLSEEDQKVMDEAYELLIEIEGNKISDKIKTYHDLKNLEEKIEKAEEKLDSIDIFDSERYDNQTKKVLALTYAYNNSIDKPWKYYYCGAHPEYMVINLPLSILIKIGKVISVHEYNRIYYEFKSLYFEEIRLEDCGDLESFEDIAKDATPDDLSDLIALRKIFESDIQIDSKRKKYNDFVDSNEHLLKTYFDKRGDDHFQIMSN